MAITKGPLSGMRALDMTQDISGPFGTMLLGDLGAEVIKLEVSRGDTLRNGGKKVKVTDTDFLSLNRNKKSIILNTDSEPGRKSFNSLIKKSDIFFSNSRPDFLKKHGYDFASIAKINPDIIYCNISGYGETGTYKDNPSYDVVVCGQSGILSISGDPKVNKPVIPGGIQMGDMISGIFAVMSILASIIARTNMTKEKAVNVDINLFNTLLLMQKAIFQHYFSFQQIPGFQGRRHTMLPTYGVFATSDGHITIGPTNENLLLKLADLEWMLEDPKFDNTINRIVNKDDFTREFENAMRKKTTDEWVKIFRDENDFASGPVLSYKVVADDPQILHNRMIKDMEIKGEKYKTVASLFSRLPDLVEGEPETAPDLGDHTDEILRDLLGYSNDEIDAIKEENKAAC